VIPGQVGLEAGQSAVGDLLDWWVRNVLGKEASYHATLTEKASKLQAGESGLLSLDWNNGNRNILGDQLLSGLLIGQTLATTDYEIYRALIEATAFGAKKIIDLVESRGIVIDQVVATGGIGHKNELFMQIYADVIGYPVHLVDNPETVAVGAAIMGVIAAKKDVSLIGKLSVKASKVYQPNAEASATYLQLYQLYSELHDAFGTPDFHQNLYHTMKTLIEIRDNATQSTPN
jgi:L-ribulokinase